MFSKIVFVLATVYVVNAAVVNVNVFDDDPDTEVASNPKDCNFRGCDQLCRRLKLPGGACVNGHCKCDNFLNAEDGVSEKSLPNLDNSVSQQDDPEAEVAVRSSKCNLTACDLVCRWVKKTSGSCVNGRCTCDNFLNAEDGVSEKSLPNLDNSVSQQDDPEAEVAVRSSKCNLTACDLVCRWVKKTSGSCVNGRCTCAKSLVAEDSVDEYSELATKRICNLRQCNRTCTCRGYESARCINGWCKCYNKIQRQATSPINDVTSDNNEESNFILRTNEEKLTASAPSA